MMCKRHCQAKSGICCKTLSELKPAANLSLHDGYNWLLNRLNYHHKFSRCYTALNHVVVTVAWMRVSVCQWTIW